MCFSANASFTASAFLSLVGLISINKVRVPKQYLFAAIPFLFGIQQFVEGLIWKNLAAQQEGTFYILTYLSFVFIVWPIVTPLAVYLLETNKPRKYLISLCILTGILIACASCIAWYFEYPTAVIESCHILYLTHIPSNYLIFATIAYLIATVVPFFISSNPAMKWMGIALTFSYLVSFIAYYEFLLSIWCFFVAILSILVVALI